MWVPGNLLPLVTLWLFVAKPAFPLQSSHGNTMKQFMDIFSLPEMTLLSCVNEHFLKNNIDYEPVHLYKDVKVRAEGRVRAACDPVASQRRLATV